jgi:integrase
MSASIPLTDPLSVAWIQWCRNAHVPANTIGRRTSTLTHMPNAGTATREDVEAWWLTRAHLAPASRANDLANLRSFFKWCRRWEYRDDDPTLRLDSPRVEPGLPRPITNADLRKALDLMPPDLRRAVCLGAYAGLRISEVAALDWSDVDLGSRQIRVMNSKRGKSRLVPIGSVLFEALLPNVGGNVITGGEPKSTTTIAKRMKEAFHRLDIEVTFHQLRHRYGTVAYKATGDILAVSRLMGHSDINTTKVYAAANDEVAARIAEAVAA